MNPSTPKFIRVTAFFSGRVQGVGFRQHTCRAAASLDVTGTVQNLSDGRVRVVVEGESQVVEQFLARTKAPTAGQVTKVEQFQSEASHEYRDFQIVHS